MKVYEERDGQPANRDNGQMTSLPVRDDRAGPRRAILGQLPRMYRADGSPIRVLLVDDERALTNLVRMALQYEGWEIDVSS
jgi:two-component system response regulator TrcR